MRLKTYIESNFSKNILGSKNNKRQYINYINELLYPCKRIISKRL